ncbi:hypothetical protein MAM1_0035d02628 [Mucor ambiguus]|uniref:Kinetochore protein NDC80 n=1 Tax=Mucor ambiguus TaxID=91626 RepID=A0A0C9MJ82_9FUNG|nr:hypothetical protein MAM1_0035d02628 [Mucor ambiguus]
MSENRKRPLPSSNIPGFPAKRVSRLSVGMDKLNISNDEGLSTIDFQGTTFDQPLLEEPSNVDIDQAAEASTPSALVRITHSQHEQYTSNHPHTILSSILHPSIESSLATRFNENSVTPTIRKHPSDPRDIKSADTQRRYAQAIADYLEKIGFKEFVPQHRAIRSLSSKDFHYIYTHLVQHYDPSLRHKSKIEDHVIEIMNDLKYPLRDSISRKSLLSIGAIHSNANFYGLLHWLMEACKSRDVANPKEFKDPPVADLEIEENAIASAFAEFSFATYRKYISSTEEPTYDEEMDPLINRFGKKALILFNLTAHSPDLAVIAEERDRDIQEMDTEIAALREEIAMLESESEGSKIEDLKKRNSDLTRDGAKFRNYCQEKRKRVEKYRSINKVVEDEVKRLDSENHKLEQQKAELEEKLKEKNVPLATLESLVKEHEAETKRCADLTAHLETRRLAYNEKVETLMVLRDKVRKQADEFNTKVKKLFPTVQEQHEFLLVYNPGATTANELLSYDVDQKLTPVLDRLEITERQDFDQITLETQRLREKTDALNADIQQIKMELAEKQKEVEMKAKKFEDGLRQFREDNEKYNILTEKHEKALDDECNRSRDSLIKARNRLLAEEARLQDMKRRFEEEQEELLMAARQLTSQFAQSQEELLPMLESLAKLIDEK